MKRLVRSKTNSARKTAEPFFDILNRWSKESLINGKICKVDKECKEALLSWKQCQDDCSSHCLFHISQNWIRSSNIKGVADLCDLLTCLTKYMECGKKLSKRKNQDLWKWKRLPGSYGCKQ